MLKSSLQARTAANRASVRMMRLVWLISISGWLCTMRRVKFARRARVNVAPHRRVCVRANCLEGWLLCSSAGAWKNEVALLAARPFARFALSFGKQNAKLNHEGDQ